MKDKKNILAMNKRIVLTGAFSALVIILAVTKLGFIPIGSAASITILQIPVILIAMLCGLPEACFVGAVFGLMSLIQAAMSPSGVLDPYFANPLCSVLPRLLLGVVAWGLWKIFKIASKLSKENIVGVTFLFGGFVFMFCANTLKDNIFVGIALTIILTAFFWIVLVNASKIPEPFFAAVTGFFATIVHTIMVIGALYLFTKGGVQEKMNGTGYFALLLALAPNAILEACASAIFCTAVYIGLFFAGKKKSKLSRQTSNTSEPEEISEPEPIE